MSNNSFSILTLLSHRMECQRCGLTLFYDSEQRKIIVGWVEQSETQQQQSF